MSNAIDYQLMGANNGKKESSLKGKDSAAVHLNTLGVNELQKIIISESGVTIVMRFFRIDRTTRYGVGLATPRAHAEFGVTVIRKKAHRSTMKRIYFVGLKNIKSYYTS